jgi:phosphatidylinositol alpha-1,6-mannosyltransferase
MNRSLFITNDFPPMLGGLATLYSRLCAAAPPERVVVLAPGVKGGALFDQKQPYRILRRWAPTNIHPIARLLQVGSLLAGALRAVPRERISRIQLGHLYLGPIALVVKRLYKTPYIIYLHGGDMAGYTRWSAVRWVVGAILRSAELVVVNSAFTRDYYRGMGFDLPRVEILTMPASLERFSPDLDVAPVLLRYRLDGAKILLTVGRLVARKGHDLVIKSLPRVVESVGDVRYIIVGSGPEEERLRALARAMNCTERVIFARSVSDEEIPLLYAACDVFVMPSRALAARDGVEGFGIVFLEAGASGKPVVGGRSGGISEAVVDGATGLLVDPSNANELQSTLITLLRDPVQANRLGAEGRVRAERLESAWEQAVERIWTL